MCHTCLGKTSRRNLAAFGTNGPQHPSFLHRWCSKARRTSMWSWTQARNSFIAFGAASRCSLAGGCIAFCTLPFPVCLSSPPLFSFPLFVPSPPLPSPCCSQPRALCRALMSSVLQGGAGQRCPAGAPSALRLAQLHGGPDRGGGAGQRLPSRLPALRLRLAGLTSERRAGGRHDDAAIKVELRARSCVRRHGAGRGTRATPGP